MRILTVSANVDLKRRVQVLLGDRSSEVFWEGSFDRVLDRFENDTFDIMLIASQLFRDSQEGVETLQVLADRCPITQVLFLLEPRHMSIVRTVLRAGTYQYARMPVADEELRVLVESAWEHRPKVGANLLLKEDEEGLDDLVGQSKPMQDIYRGIRQAAVTDVPVLIQGETGTGKDLAGRVIHRQSARHEGPYVTVNVGGIPPEMVASELFGYEKGAFPGADVMHPGRFEQASGGTVFLDQIGAIEEREQISLIRFLEDRNLRRLGGTHQIRADIRLLAASSTHLAQLVREGSIRDDLYYRLDVFQINLPPLRDRHGDIPLLAGHYIQRYNRAFQKRVAGLTPECSGMLEAYPWPGNVRELRNVLQRAVMMCGGEIITPEHLPVRLRQKPSGFNSEAVSFRIGATLQEVEREMIIRTLRSTGNNRQQTAQILGISRRALYNKLDRHGIE
jgi:DNA-binding NtrC family response regulator